MYYKSLRIPAVMVAGTALTLLTGCSDTLPDSPVTENEGPLMTVNLQGFPSSPGSENLIELFQFRGGEFMKKVTTDGSEDSEPIVFSKSEDTRIYALSGYSVEADETTTEEVFSRTQVACPEGVQSAPLFYSAVVAPDLETNSVDMKLIRGVSRIDVNNLDQDLHVSEVTVTDAPSATYLFPLSEGTCEADPVSFTQAFSTGVTGLEKGVFTIYESSRPVNIVIKGAKNGEVTETQVSIPTVARNKVYTITLSKDDPDDPGEEPIAIRPSLTVADWEDGDDYGLSPDNTSGIRLDVKASGFPSTVTYDEATGFIRIPAEGIENLKLAFRSDIRVEIDTLLLRGEYVEKDSLPGRACKVLGRTVREDGNDILTTYTLNIQPQLICRSEYTISVAVRKASMVSSYDFFNLSVAPHPKQIQTVLIGGREWMCFNATSANLEDQIFPLDGVSVDEMYNEHFVDCVGMYFQYGKENPFSPWTSNNPAQFADQTRDIPWATPERMPLPEGYHVASAEDWKALMPNGIVLPSAWMTASGDSIKGSVVTLPGFIETPSAAVNAKKFLMRYVLFESVTTGAKLYVPFGGLKSNSNVEVPGYGGSRLETRTAYWLKEDRYTWLIDYKATPEKTDGGVLKQDRWNYDGFLLVRGVKD